VQDCTRFLDFEDAISSRVPADRTIVRLARAATARTGVATTIESTLDL
jgi:hypothetical protein